MGDDGDGEISVDRYEMVEHESEEQSYDAERSWMAAVAATLLVIIIAILAAAT
jgi:hypothetical protein